ncbi:MAG TPA: GT4 family glycosyltransferase PelF [Bdellovibrionota bacterium]|nr:GT4 family glycosyltransferase PelF [Bdellovibrionota bacterium]
MNDVCLILEGTYPYVKGGVSECVYNLIKNLPHITFSIVHITPTGDTPREILYPLPPNIKEFREVFLFDLEFFDKKKFDTTTEEDWNKIIGLHNAFKSKKVGSFEEIYNIFFHPQKKKLSLDALFESRQAWRLIEYMYMNSHLEHSFSDFFWNWRFIHYPIFKIFSYKVPLARIYHTLCTGYAGALTVAAKIQTRKPALLTEHGIYSLERQLEISQANWIVKVPGEETLKAQRTPGFFKQWWINVFNMLGRLTYEYADDITTIFEGNRMKQIALGADPLKTSVIPNGINIDIYKNFQSRETQNKIYKIGFVGRVVPIKDIKTFIRAIKIVYDKIKNIDVLILGPADEDREYFEECQTLVRLLGLNHIVEFKGTVSLEQYYQELDLIVLTSISEGLPLVILEGNAAGIPIVATDVGGCRELLEGRTEDDRELGQSGIITLPSTPTESAQAMVKLLENDELRRKMGEAGRKRMELYYREEDIIKQYNVLYQKYL